MLVIISDLHLTDGSTGEILDDKAFRIFRNRISDMAYDASWRKSDVGDRQEYYQPIECINILLLGDILDLIRSNVWNEVEERNMPWSSERSNDFFENINAIVEKVLIYNEKSFAILNDIANGGIEIPLTATQLSKDKRIDGKNAHEVTGLFRPKVKIFYMVGNHDWFFYINDERLNNIRNKVIECLGLCNKRDTKFPFFPEDDADLKNLQEVHNVYAIHGDVFDESNYSTSGRDGSSLGDVIVLKLLNEIPFQIQKQIEQFPADKRGSIKDSDAFIKDLRELDNLRPYRLAPQWISHVIEKYQLDLNLVNKSMRNALRTIIDHFVKNPLVSEHHNMVVMMHLTQFLLKTHFTIEDLAVIIESNPLKKEPFESYRTHVKNLITKVENDGICFYVMGHTHYPEVVPMSSYTKNGIDYNKVYLNTGTWRTLHKEAYIDNNFVSYKTLTYAGFFKGNERKGHSFEYWTGYLDL